MKADVVRLDIGHCWVPVVVPVKSNGDWPELPDWVDLECTYGYIRSGMSGCRYYKHAHQTMSGSVELPDYPVLAVPKEGMEPDVEQLPEATTWVVQLYLEKPLPVLEAAAEHGYIESRVYIDRIIAPQKALWALSNYMKKGSYTLPNAWAYFNFVECSYTAELVAPGEPDIVLGTLPKRVANEVIRFWPPSIPSGYMAADDEHGLKIAVRFDQDGCRESWYIRTNNPFYWEEGDPCDYVGWERWGGVSHAPCIIRCRPKELYRIAVYHLGDVIVLPTYYDDDHSFEPATNRQLEKLSLTNCSIRSAEGGLEVIPENKEAPVVISHPEHGSIVLNEGMEARLYQVPYTQRGHGD